MKIALKILQDKSSNWFIVVSTGSQRAGGRLPSPTVKIRPLSFSGTKSRFVTGFLTGSNTLRKCLHFIQMIYSSLCRNCEAKEGDSAHVLCECQTLPSVRYAYLGFFFLDPEEVKGLSLEGQLKLQ